MEKEKEVRIDETVQDSVQEPVRERLGPGMSMEEYMKKAKEARDKSGGFNTDLLIIWLLIFVAILIVGVGAYRLIALFV